MESRRKKVAVIIPKYGLIGGAEGYVAELTERIARNPVYEVHVFANRWVALSDCVTFHRVPVISFPKFLTTVSFAYFVKKRIDKMDFDIVHTHDRIFAADIFTMHGVPHRFWTEKVRHKKMMSLYDRATIWVERKFVHEGQCARYLAVSGLAREIFMKEYSPDPRLVEVVNPGCVVFEDNNREQRHDKKDIREKFGIDLEVPLILFVSMNFEVKGLGSLIAGLGELKRRQSADDFRLLVVGKGDQEAYRRLARKAGIEGHVIFAGSLPRGRLKAVYRAGDIYAMLSQFDTFGLVVLEAMAASLPVVISGNVGAKDVVREGVNGFVIEDTADAGRIAEKIGLLLNEERRIQMGRDALQTAREHTWDTAADKVLRVYEEIIQNRVNSKIPQP